MNLSEHFTFEELTITQVRDVDNTPPPEIVEHLKALAAALEQVRALLGLPSPERSPGFAQAGDHPVIVSSGYRSAEVNRRVGGVPTSAHLNGYAADFICPGFGDPLAICRALAAGTIPFDQVIEEGTWVHFSVDPRMRSQVLTKTADGYASGLRQP